MLTIGLVLLMAILSVLACVVLLALVGNDRNSDSSGGGVVFLLFVVMALFLWRSTVGSTEDAELSSVEYVSEKENKSAENAHYSVGNERNYGSNVKSSVVEKSIFEGKLVKGIYVGLMAFLPAVFYLLFVISSDDKKPEPMPVLLLAVTIGAALAVVGKFLGYTLYECGLPLISDVPTSLNIGFVRIAILSETAKWLILLVFLAFNKYYDEYLDGIVYAVCVSMGFACIQCVGYMIYFMGSINSTFYIQGLVTFLVLIPMNMMLGAIMGYFVALAKHRNKLLNYVLSIVLPVLTSGVLYSILAYMDDVLWHYLIFVLILTPLSYIFYRLIWHLMKLDARPLGD